MSYASEERAGTKPRKMSHLLFQLVLFNEPIREFLCSTVRMSHT